LSTVIKLDVSARWAEDRKGRDSTGLFDASSAAIQTESDVSISSYVKIRSAVVIQISRRLIKVTDNIITFRVDCRKRGDFFRFLNLIVMTMRLLFGLLLD